MTNCFFSQFAQYHSSSSDQMTSDQMNSTLADSAHVQSSFMADSTLSSTMTSRASTIEKGDLQYVIKQQPSRIMLKPMKGYKKFERICLDDEKTMYVQCKECARLNSLDSCQRKRKMYVFEHKLRFVK